MLMMCKSRKQALALAVCIFSVIDSSCCSGCEKLDKAITLNAWNIGSCSTSHCTRIVSMISSAQIPLGPVSTQLPRGLVGDVANFLVTS